MRIWTGFLIVYAGILGAAGVAGSAAAAHASSDPRLATAATFAVLHAAAIAAIGLAARPQGAGAPISPILALSGTILAAGSLLFCGDLAKRAILGSGLFPMAAPAGGILLIAGWLALALAGGAMLVTGPRDTQR